MQRDDTLKEKYQGAVALMQECEAVSLSASMAHVRDTAGPCRSRHCALGLRLHAL